VLLGSVTETRINSTNKDVIFEDTYVKAEITYGSLITTNEMMISVTLAGIETRRCVVSIPASYTEVSGSIVGPMPTILTEICTWIFSAPPPNSGIVP
jgi:hypothetical protein